MTRARSGALLALAAALLAGCGTAEAPPTVQRAVMVLIPGASFEEAMGVPEVFALARAGGAGLLVRPGSVAVDDDPPWAPSDAVRVVRADLGSPTLGDEIRTAVGEGGREEVLVIVASDAAPSDAGSRDELAPIVMAVGPPAALFPEDGLPGSLTSDSSRRNGVVAGVDVEATLRVALTAPGGSGGEPIEVVEGPPPFELHERYLSQRRMYVPIGAAAALYGAAAGLAAVAALAVRGRRTRRWRRIAGWATLSIPMLATGMLAAGHLAELTYATAVPMIALVAVFGTMAFSPLERREVALVPAGIGAAVLALFVVEAAVGWSGMLTPLLGGSQLDGGRFFGLPNVGIGLLVGASLWVAQRLGTTRGFVLLCAAGLFAGLPLVGSNLGGAVTAFAAAGAWLAVRERRRLGWLRGVGVVVGVTAVGAAVVLAAHAVSPVETHVTRFERAAGGIGGVLERYADRMRVGFDLIGANPAALVPVLGLPAALAVALRPPPSIRASFDRWPAWRDAVVVLLLSGIVAYLANDSGPAAAGLAFGLGLGGMLGVSLLAEPGKMGAP